MKAKLIAIVAVALLLQTAAQAGPFRSVSATSTQTIDIPRGMAVTVINFVSARATNFPTLSVQFDSDTPMSVLTATTNGVTEIQKDLVISARGADGRARALKLIIGVPSGDVAFLTYRLSAN